MALAAFLIHAFSSCSFQELSAFPREVGGSWAGLHPVVYPCTALLLLCLFSTIITYILNHRWALLQEGDCGGKAGDLYWQVFLSQVGPCDFPRLLPSLLYKGSGVGRYILGVESFLPWSFYHMRAHTCTRTPVFPLQLFQWP